MSFKNYASMEVLNIKLTSYLYRLDFAISYNSLHEYLVRSLTPLPLDDLAELLLQQLHNIFF